ncbi:MAG: hypothetical protein QOE36_406 [Gaiellaceae bacterium]|jgi:hypothetical protein|nr:hypothetical protein [Gaiellaceae bacterium]
MIGFYASDMVGFFDELAREGRTDIRPWRSEFAEVELRTTNLDNGIVALDFFFWWARGGTLDNEAKASYMCVPRGATAPRLLAKVAAQPGFSA